MKKNIALLFLLTINSLKGYCTITGSAAVCPGSQVTYTWSPTTTPEPTYSSLKWTIEGGILGTDITSKSVATSWISAGTGAVIVTFYDANKVELFKEKLDITINTTNPAQPILSNYPSWVKCGDTQTQYTFEVNADPNVVDYWWSIPNFRIDDSKTARTPNGKYTTKIIGNFYTFVSGDYINCEVIAYSNVCSGSSSRPFAISTIPLAPTFSGTDLIPAIGTPQNYSCYSLGVSNFQWSTNSSYASIIGGQGGSSINVRFDQVGIYTITATAINSCGSKASSSFNTPQVVCLAPPVFSSPQMTPNKGAVVSYSVVPSSQNGVTYQWAGSGTATPVLVSAQQNSASFKFLSEGPGTISVNALNQATGCSSTSSTINVNSYCTSTPSNAINFYTPETWVSGFGTGMGFSDQDNYYRTMADVNGDGKNDIVAFTATGVVVSLSTGTSFGASGNWINTWFSRAQGWNSQNTLPRMVSDVNNDGKADLVGFAAAGVFVALSTGTGFSSPTQWVDGYGTNTGWSNQASFPRFILDVNGDKLNDIVGFAGAGVMVSLNKGNSFAPMAQWVAGYGINNGWSSTDSYPRTLADVTGDGLPDVVGFAQAGVVVAINKGTFFQNTPSSWSTGFCPNAGFLSQNQFPRFVQDMNNDGKADIVGFGKDQVVVALSDGFSTFGNSLPWAFGFGTAMGFSDMNTYPRMFAKLNDDNLPDLIAFAQEIIIALNLGSTFDCSITQNNSGMFSNSGGWSSQTVYPRFISNVNTNSLSEIVGFASQGVIVQRVNCGNATPSFKINNQTPHADGSPIQVPSCTNIICDGSATSCETKFYVGVQESDPWWNRTLLHEWGMWFQGEVPNNLDIAALTAVYSGTQYGGTGLFNLHGGLLSNGAPRCYRFVISTNEPTLNQLYTVFQINDGTCKTEPTLGDISKLIPLNKPKMDGSSTNNNSILEIENGIVSRLSNSPNPYSKQTTISYSLRAYATITIKIFDLQGRMVDILINQETKDQGDYSILFEGTNLTGGIYYYSLETSDQKIMRKMVLIK
jgi:hypothetical protein